ncbi:hypothetical protein C0389_10595 [bacterium]|nr:hypothetical protein [bacterium]
MSAINCWEYKKCGREPGGDKVDELGICPAATEKRADKLNGGVNGGRTCWGVKNTLCGNEVRKVFALHLAKCLKCDFYQLVSDEEHDWTYSDTKAILRKLG